jgi:hypothetical protein
MATPSITVTHRRLKYSCWENGLDRSGTHFIADLTPYLPILKKNGTVLKGATSRLRKQTPTWWSAQCAFRGLPSTGTLPELQARLRSGPNVMLQELVELEAAAVAEYKAKKAITDKEQEEGELEEARKEVEVATQRLKSLFFDSGDVKKSSALVFQDDWSGMPDAATSLDLQYYIMRNPGLYDSDENYSWEWIVIGRTKEAAKAKVESLLKEEREREASRKKEEKAKEQAQRETFQRKIAEVARSSVKGGKWDVTGTWKITCQEIESEWDQHEDMTLTIFRVHKEGHSEIFGEFNFGLVEGWLRFEPQESKDAVKVKPEGTLTGQKRKRVDEDSDDERDYDDDERDYDADELHEEFHLPPTHVPSKAHPTWNYRWRGRETGEGEIQLESDKNLESITFSGEGGAKLKGWFKCEYLKRCEFEGAKIELGDPRAALKISIETEWTAFNERAYNYASTARWGGW